mmetsp:Transcript_8987/g.11925  ORF Transcript_8987/g.11925 Transcript_8987/m.11925 type:complete len:723 (+) Transcript_8987:49-2217(+)
MQVKFGEPWFYDDKNRVCLLRGINLSGNVKSPKVPAQPSQEKTEFYSRRQEVSFVGRPFALDEADEHFTRLRSWGFTFVRYNITWEALEHQGPGRYDNEYIEYVIKVLKKARDYGFSAFIDPHQDVWSRFCGGSGAPAWTLEAVGFQVENLHAARAVFLHCEAPEETKKLPMIWQTNYFKLACATMFTLFFGGNAYAPKLTALCTLPGHENQAMPIQDFLQLHFISAVCRLAQRVVDAGLGEMVVGYDSMNEPSGGYIGTQDLNGPTMPSQELKLGLTPTAFQGMLLGEGQAVQNVEVWGKLWGSRGLIPACKYTQPEVRPSSRAWKEGAQCVWAQHGVWDLETGRLEKPDYFARNPETGEPVDWIRDFWYPFALRFQQELREAHPGACLFIEPPVGLPPPLWDLKQGEGVVFAPHWYDGLTLISRRWNGWFNVNYLAIQRKTKNVLRTIGRPRKVFAEMLQMLKEDGVANIGATPCLIGEVGIPYDLNGRSAYQTGNYAGQLAAYDANLTALEHNLLSYTLWCYVEDNNNQWGDQWNGEDLSIYSRDDQEELMAENQLSWWKRLWCYCSSPKYRVSEGSHTTHINTGGRALEALLRPVPEKTAAGGVPQAINFDYQSPWFCYTFQTDGKQYHEGERANTEIWLPDLHFPFEDHLSWENTIRVSGGDWVIERRNIDENRDTPRHRFSRFTWKTFLVWSCEYTQIPQTHKLTIGKKRMTRFFC